MADKKDIDLGLDPLHTYLTREEAAKEPCFGGCGKSYLEAGGGWFEFEKVGEQVQLAPRWYCTPCSDQRGREQDHCLKADEEVKH